MWWCVVHLTLYIYYGSLITPSILHAAQGEIPVPENCFLRNILILTGVALLFFQWNLFTNLCIETYNSKHPCFYYKGLSNSSLLRRAEKVTCWKAFPVLINLSPISCILKKKQLLLQAEQLFSKLRFRWTEFPDF